MSLPNDPTSPRPGRPAVATPPSTPHPDAVRLTRRRLGLLGLASLGLVTQTGCMTTFANLINAVRGYSIEPEFTGLEEKRVAVVTITDNSRYSDDAAARLLSRRVSDILREKVKGIDLVREDEVHQWRDRNGWDAIEFLDIGRGVKADKVLGIEMVGLRLREGATLFRGSATITVTVYDIPTDTVEFRRHLEDFTYPVSAGMYTSETTEFKFRGIYLGVLGSQIARYFHGYDAADSFALDAAIASQ